MSFNREAYFLAKSLNLNAAGHTGATSSSLPPIVIHSSDYFTNPDYLKPKKKDNCDANAQKIDNSSPRNSKSAQPLLEALLKDGRDEGDSEDEYDSDSSIEVRPTPQTTPVSRRSHSSFKSNQQNHQNVNSSQAHHQSPPQNTQFNGPQVFSPHHHPHFHASHQSSYSPTSSVPSTDSPTFDFSTLGKQRQYQKKMTAEQLRALEDRVPVVKKSYKMGEIETICKELNINANQFRYWAKKKRMEMEHEEKENEQ